MEGKCMRCGKPEHQPGQKCPVQLVPACKPDVFFNKLEVSKLDSRFSSFAIISSYIRTLSMYSILNPKITNTLIIAGG